MSRTRKREKFFVHTLGNGIRCILKRVPTSAVCYCSMTIGAGSRDEEQGEYGIAHLLEHTLFKGTRKRKAWQVNCRLENLGGEINAFTTKEETVVHATVLRRDFEKAVELIDDIIFHSTFPAAEVAKEKEVVYDEIGIYKDTPDERIYDEFEEFLFEGSELGHPILGTRTTVRRHTSPKLASFVERNYTTDRMVFAVCGPISEGCFVMVVERWLGAEKPTVRTSKRTRPMEVEQFNKEVGRGMHQVRSVMGTRAFALDNPKRVPLILLTNLLGGPTAASRLNVALRERNALTYCTEALYTPLSDTGMFTIFFSCEKDKLEQCRAVVRTELQRLVEEPLTPRQLAVAKRQLIGQFAISAENGEAYMLGVGKSYLAFGTVDSLDEIYARVEDITAEEIRAVAEEVFANLSSLTYL
ncbi:MAG: insulinase family protein [Tidjanibacter sp.]|nr:insulinase family protein [Tidjanibacter sp.]MBR3853070.1 insulinase family protein [Tidjanibacter sp.]